MIDSNASHSAIDIAMLTCNRLRITALAISELKERTTSPYRLLVVDNGSVDGTQDFLDGMLSAGIVDELRLLPDNKGVHYGHNALLEMVESDLYISTDNDLIPQSPQGGVDWLAWLSDLMAMHPEYAAIACRPHVMIGDSVTKIFENAPAVVERGHIGAHLRMMRTSSVRNVGGWSTEIRPSRNHEEKWICGLLREAGHKVGYARDVHCIHLFGDPELGEDDWGYTKGTYHEGHREVWPPVHRFQWSLRDVDWESCR